MNTSNATHADASTDYELRYCPLQEAGKEYAFPCDCEGHVDLDELSERERNDYFYARAVVGRELEQPAVLPH